MACNVALMRCDVLAWHLTSWLRLKPKTNENMPAAGHLLGLQLPRSAPVAATGIEAGTGPKGTRDHADTSTSIINRGLNALLDRLPAD